MKRILIPLAILTVLLAGILFWATRPQPRTQSGPEPSTLSQENGPLPHISSEVVKPALTVAAPVVPVKTKISAVTRLPAPAKTPPKKEEPFVQPPKEMLPPPVEIHEELIPKNIDIVRVYYESDYVGPGSQVEFDINGSGFTKEFEKMIEVQSGHELVKVKNLRLLTPNQVRGILVVDSKAPTFAIFPKVLIRGQVVFQAAQYLAIIRPGEVFNLVFTEMLPSGRQGRIRVLTNLTEEMHRKFAIAPSTSSIWVSDVQPQLPFIVDATVNIGPAPIGNYDLKVSMAEKILWEGREIIRIMRPNLGETGLLHRLTPLDGFHRPGDRARFVIQGSGFRKEDTSQLNVVLPGFDQAGSSFVYVSPGRLELYLDIPLTAQTTFYALKVTSGDKTLLNSERAFLVVPANWLRSVRVDPPVKPGGKSALVLEGRDLSDAYVSQIQIESDEPGLAMGPFKRESPIRALSDITVGKTVSPGDYWLKMKDKQGPIEPFFGSIIQVSK